jgi:hypothetical protein
MGEYDKEFKEIGETLHGITEALVALERDLAKLGHGLAAVKETLARQISPEDSAKGLARIQQLENEIAGRDPKAKVRRQAADTIQAVRLMDKHGPPRQS